MPESFGSAVFNGVALALGGLFFAAIGFFALYNVFSLLTTGTLYASRIGWITIADQPLAFMVVGFAYIACLIAGPAALIRKIARKNGD